MLTMLYWANLNACVVDVPFRPSCVDSLAGWQQDFFLLNMQNLFQLRWADPSRTVKAICADLTLDNLQLSSFSIDLTLCFRAAVVASIDRT